MQRALDRRICSHVVLPLDAEQHAAKDHIFQTGLCRGENEITSRKPEIGSGRSVRCRHELWSFSRIVEMRQNSMATPTSEQSEISM